MKTRRNIVGQVGRGTLGPACRHAQRIFNGLQGAFDRASRLSAGSLHPRARWSPPPETFPKGPSVARVNALQSDALSKQGCNSAQPAAPSPNNLPGALRRGQVRLPLQRPEAGHLCRSPEHVIHNPHRLTICPTKPCCPSPLKHPTGAGAAGVVDQCRIVDSGGMFGLWARRTMKIKGKRVLASGAGGFIGAHPAEALPCPGRR
jgi:hypothetical protein